MPGAGGRKEWRVINWCGVSFWEDDKVLEVDGGDGCRALLLYFIHSIKTPKNASNGKFYTYLTVIKTT